MEFRTEQEKGSYWEAFVYYINENFDKQFVQYVTHFEIIYFILYCYLDYSKIDIEKLEVYTNKKNLNLKNSSTFRNYLRYSLKAGYLKREKKRKI